jgi:hypothetical protein
MTPPTDAVSVILPLAAPNDPLVAAWEKHLKGTRRWGEVLTPDLAGGYGAAVRSALDAATSPLVLLTAADYPYTPADLPRLIEKLETAGEVLDPATGEWVMRTPDLVCGARTGRPVPGGLKQLGWAYRTFCRLALGLPQQPLPGWYGFGEHLRAWRAWVVYGDGLNDPHCAFKLIRRSLLDRFPIQCDGDMVHVELVAKATFLTCLMDEVHLTPQPDPIPTAVWAKKDRRALWGKPKFRKPPREAVAATTESGIGSAAPDSGGEASPPKPR